MAAPKKFALSKISGPVTFVVDDNTFEGVPANRLPAGVLARYFEEINAGKLFEAHNSLFEAILTEESWKVFSERMHSKEHPITVTLMGDIVTWLLGDQYMGSTEPTK